MQISVRQQNRVQVLDIEGNLVFGDGEGVFRDMIAKCHARKDYLILLNLAKLNRLDSTGLGVLIQAYKDTVGFGGTLKILNPSARVSMLLRITHLESVLECFDHEEQAICSFK